MYKTRGHKIRSVNRISHEWPRTACSSAGLGVGIPYERIGSHSTLLRPLSWGWPSFPPARMPNLFRPSGGPWLKEPWVLAQFWVCQLCCGNAVRHSTCPYPCVGGIWPPIPTCRYMLPYPSAAPPFGGHPRMDPCRAQAGRAQFSMYRMLLYRGSRSSRTNRDQGLFWRVLTEVPSGQAMVPTASRKAGHVHVMHDAHASCHAMALRRTWCQYPLFA